MAADNMHLVADLGSRVRALTLFHDVTRILQRDDGVSASDWLDEIVKAITRSWPTNGATGVRARLGTFEIATPDLDTLPQRHGAAFTLADGRTGSIEVAYSDGDSEAGDEQTQRALEDITEMFRIAVDRRLVMAALRQSEQQYRSVVEHQSDLVCRYLPDTTLTFVNEAYCRYFGKSRDELIGSRFIDLIPEADRPAALKNVRDILQGGEPRIDEHSVVKADGTLGRQQWIDHVIESRDGGPVELQAIGRDITDRWRAEEALRQKEMSLREAYERIRSLAHRLILAQEAERTEIARDLHDDISQQLAALGIGLSLLETRVSGEAPLRDELIKLRQVASGLAERVRHVSHSLHPGVLKHAGLHAAVASHCESVAAQHSFGVRFESRGSFQDVPLDVALCLYRATQQALRNVAMHANATSVWVTLVRVGKEIELNITDNGCGFDTSTARTRGLGLLSIEERVHLANGKFAITSRHGGGSRLSISIPVGWS